VFKEKLVLKIATAKVCWGTNVIIDCVSETISDRKYDGIVGEDESGAIENTSILSKIDGCGVN